MQHQYVYFFIHRDSWRELTAITTQHMLTYGLSRSPTRADFQNIPKILHQRTISLPVIFLHPGCASSGGRLPILVPVHDPRHYRVRIAARADYQENHEKQRLKVEKSRLGECDS